MLEKDQIDRVLVMLNTYKARLYGRSQEEIDDFKSNLSNGITADIINFLIAENCRSVLEDFSNNYDQWIRRCPYSCKYYSQYISELYVIESDNMNYLFYLSCIRFLREYFFL